MNKAYQLTLTTALALIVGCVNRHISDKASMRPNESQAIRGEKADTLAVDIPIPESVALLGSWSALPGLGVLLSRKGIPYATVQSRNVIVVTVPSQLAMKARAAIKKYILANSDLGIELLGHF